MFPKAGVPDKTWLGVRLAYFPKEMCVCSSVAILSFNDFLNESLTPATSASPGNWLETQILRPQPHCRPSNVCHQALHWLWCTLVWEPRVGFGPLWMGNELQVAWVAVCSHAAKQGITEPAPELRAFTTEVRFCLENQNDRLAVGREVRRGA